MKVHKTSKLFFGKWLYKIETHSPGASLIKHWGFETVKGRCENKKSPFHSHGFNNLDKEKLIEYLKAVEPYATSDLKTRVEWNTLSFFINDLDLYNELKTVLSKWVVSVSEPASDDDIQSLQAKSSIILCNNLPYGKYKYRIFIKNTMPMHQRLQFRDWLNNYGEKIHCSRSTIEWLDGKWMYSQSPFLYIEDQGLLLMATMFLGQNHKRTHEFVPRKCTESS